MLPPTECTCICFFQCVNFTCHFSSPPASLRADLKVPSQRQRALESKYARMKSPDGQRCHDQAIISKQCQVYRRTTSKDASSWHGPSITDSLLLQPLPEYPVDRVGNLENMREVKNLWRTPPAQSSSFFPFTACAVHFVPSSNPHQPGSLP